MTDSPQSSPESPANRLARAMQQIWQQNLGLIRERIDLLHQAAAALHTGSLSDSLRIEAAGAAHKLAGTLGSFGYPEGTEITRAIELRLEAATQPEPDLAPWLDAQLTRLQAILNLPEKSTEPNV